MAVSHINHIHFDLLLQIASAIYQEKSKVEVLPYFLIMLNNMLEHFLVLHLYVCSQSSHLYSVPIQKYVTQVIRN
jgi:hypothetical protein